MSPDEQFLQAALQWDLPRLYQDLAKVKRKGLTSIERVHLRGLLCGYGPAEIAEKLHRDPEGLKVDLSNRIYTYIKRLIGKEDEKMENWRNICEWLEEAGYKQQLNSSDKDDIDAIPGEATLRIKNLTRDKFIFEVKAQFIGSFSTINSPTILICSNQEKETSETSPESENLSGKDKQSA
jgi:hypothetical protein